MHFLPDIQWQPKGPILVASPWNFPCSIPIGGIIAALAAGNSVIFKPAPEAVLIGWELVNILWDSGVDRSVLQFFTCPDDPIGSRLIQDPRLSSVILTGATSTAQRLMKLRPGLDLHAETGGKNAVIVTSLADRDLAIKSIVQSAFGHAGQKCSACSLVILESEVYEDMHFRKQLADAAASLCVGSPWDLASVVTPLINPPSEVLKRGLTTLEEGEEWVLQPKNDPSNPRLWSPGIKIGVKSGSFMHMTELFGPVIAVMKADNLEHAISLTNATPYGLTSGIQSLDKREVDYWLKHIEVGNCYVNRTITGAVVRRQPFGGCKASSFGRGAKAGGPNYVMQLMDPIKKALPKEKEPLNDDVVALHHLVLQADILDNRLSEWNSALGSYSFFWNHHFSKKHDPSLVLGEDNFLYYKPYQKQTLRLQDKDDLVDALMALAAALTCHAPLEISLDTHVLSGSVLEKMMDPQAHSKLPVNIVVETESELIERLSNGSVKRLRLLSTPNSALQDAAAEAGFYVVVAPVAVNGRLELLNVLREVAESNDYHRYGNLGEREGEKRSLR
jgi:RHH-type proline utilization regulon transcriptional repressor/proline dehydrogenase/delta 1-pyrroline-5-carboxylate dehydrogenase